MALQVHGGAELGKILLYVAGFAAFVVVALTWAPDWISPESANITGATGPTARMINEAYRRRGASRRSHLRDAEFSWLLNR